MVDSFSKIANSLRKGSAKYILGMYITNIVHLYIIETEVKFHNKENEMLFNLINVRIYKNKFNIGVGLSTQKNKIKNNMSYIQNEDKKLYVDLNSLSEKIKNFKEKVYVDFENKFSLIINLNGGIGNNDFDKNELLDIFKLNLEASLC